MSIKSLSQKDPGTRVPARPGTRALARPLTAAQPGRALQRHQRCFCSEFGQTRAFPNATSPSPEPRAGPCDVFSRRGRGRGRRGCPGGGRRPSGKRLLLRVSLGAGPWAAWSRACRRYPFFSLLPKDHRRAPGTAPSAETRMLARRPRPPPTVLPPEGGPRSFCTWAVTIVIPELNTWWPDTRGLPRPAPP